MTLLLVAGSFFIGMAVGIVFEDAWDLLSSSRKDRVMWKPRLPTGRQVLSALLAATVAANMGLGIHLATTRATDQENAVIACENANESRAANLSLWTYVLDLSAASRDEVPTPAEQERLDDFRAWVTKLYAPRDCSDLSKRYEIPPPPTLNP